MMNFLVMSRLIDQFREMLYTIICNALAYYYSTGTSLTFGSFLMVVNLVALLHNICISESSRLLSNSNLFPAICRCKNVNRSSP